MQAFNSCKKFLSPIFPGFFIIGYVIGTGSVTSIVVGVHGMECHLPGRYFYSQAFSPIMMPVFIIFLLILLNRKKVMKENTIGFWLNTGLVITLLFSVFMFYVAWEGYAEFFK
jgi:Mn2+/Fe2+ NRAMP family transporter